MQGEVGNVNLYKAIFVLKDKNTVDGFETEHYDNLSLSDFEIIYGNETREIESLTLIRKEDFKK